MSKFVYESQIKSVSAYLHFNKKGIAQTLIHHLKYKAEPSIGELLGQWYGHDLLDVNWKIDVIIPVPLHRSKLKKRGYNQSEHFAIGLSESMGIPVETNAVGRRYRTATQTKKTKVERWQNVDAIYQVLNSTPFIRKNVLLVDDVLTTGATLGELVDLLLKSGANEIRIATIAAGK